MSARRRRPRTRAAAANTSEDSNSLASRVVASTTSFVGDTFSPLKRSYAALTSSGSDESSSEREVVFSTARPAPSVTPKRPRTLDEMIERQQTKRVGARETIEFLQSGAAIGCGPTVVGGGGIGGGGGLRREERNVVIDEERFKALGSDSPTEFQDAYKPPWAPRLPPHKIAELQTWERMEVLSEIEVLSQPWMTLIQIVAGLIQVPLSTLVVRSPQTSSSQSVRASRVRGGYESALPIADVGTGASAALAALTQQTPFRESVPEAPGEQIEALRRGEIAELDILSAPPQPPPPQRRLLPPQNSLQIDEMLFGAVAEVTNELNEAEGGVARSGARFERLRRQAKAKAPPPPFYVDAPTDAARILNQQVRAATANARAWAARSTATGVYFLTPAYTAARDLAHTRITNRAAQLANVPMSAFIRDDKRTDSAQRKVRVNFAELIAHFYNLARHNSNRSAKLASDAINITAAAEDVLSWFIHRVFYDKSTRMFIVHSTNQRNVGEKPVFCGGVLGPTFVSHNPFLYNL